MTEATSATVLMPGTCGELVQGMSSDSHFLVSCPIDILSRVTVELRESPEIKASTQASKSVAALQLVLNKFGYKNMGAAIYIQSDLPSGKGMGSSTADVAGTVYAAAAALNQAIPAEEVARICVSIEPTDSSIFPGVALFDHRNGNRYEWLGPAPELDILVLDLGGEVDTLSYNALDRTADLRSLSLTSMRALQLVREGLNCGDIEKIGAGATLSARAHQKILPKPPLENIIAIGSPMGAVGVDVGHSGTVIGVLFPRHSAPLRAFGELMEISGAVSGRWCSMVNGGPRYADERLETKQTGVADLAEYPCQ
jgi:L-threonine kinase